MKNYIFIGLILVAVLVSGCVQSSPKFAAISGWLFEVETDVGTERFLVAFEEHSLPSAPKVFLRVLNEEQLLELTGTDKWVGPFEKHTQEEWELQCKQKQHQLLNCTQENWEFECTQNPGRKDCQSFDYWLPQCESFNERVLYCQDLPYEEYKNMMLSYMQENGIEGEIVNKYVGYFMIVGSGLDFPDNQ